MAIDLAKLRWGRSRVLKLKSAALLTAKNYSILSLNTHSTGSALHGLACVLNLKNVPVGTDVSTTEFSSTWASVEKTRTPITLKQNGSAYF
jgi:hypothetical protein